MGYIDVFVFFCVLFSALFIGSVVQERVCLPLLIQIEESGYDSKEVRVFCKRIDCSLEDFIASKGLKKQYEKFLTGENTDFISASEQHKQKDDARSDGQATGQVTGLTTGIIIGTSVGR